jgi:hypothetical protein
MATTFIPFGLKPAYHPSGLDRSVPFVGTNTYISGSDYTAPFSLEDGQAFYQYTPVAITTAGQLTIAANAAATRGVYGSFDGVEFTDSQGRRSVAKWAAKTTLLASTEIVFWIFADPALVYEIQCNGSVTSAAIGQQYDFDATNGADSGYSIGNGGAGFSTTALAASDVGTATQGQVRVVGLGREAAFPFGETNQWGDTYTIVQVQISNNQFSAPAVSV